LNNKKYFRICSRLLHYSRLVVHTVILAGC